MCTSHVSKIRMPHIFTIQLASGERFFMSALGPQDARDRFLDCHIADPRHTSLIVEECKIAFRP